ncbi:hypothetical protein CXB51_034055 [Gossypium anomalum]|uniref:DUF7745 domain-containing protein n=1 Tax=Gossypium anomalum TaxID=47600 RepID=A0A8J5YPC9_9ROSI|nr:hypothetical protein CXB51_034055 [Gossypium anomalum]
MENGLFDRVEGNANIHRWSEQTQLGKGDSITVGYMLELLDYTRISVTRNNLQELKVDLVPTVEEYTSLLRCPRFQYDKIYSRAACVPTFGKKLMTVTGMSEQWILARIKEKGESKCIPALGYVDEATTDLFYRLSKRVTSVPAILVETFKSLNACRRASAGRFFGCAQLLLAWFYSHFRLIDRMNLQSKDVEWRASWMIPGENLCRYGSFDWVPLLGIWGAIGYAALLVLRQHGLRQFIPTTYGLVQRVAISPATTPGYVEWRGRRINDNIPRPSMEEARPMEEYLQVKPSELEIMKQEFERKSLELEKRIVKLEEEKIYLSLDVDVQKMEVEKEKKEKRKIEMI